MFFFSFSLKCMRMVHLYLQSFDTISQMLCRCLFFHHVSCAAISFTLSRSRPFPSRYRFSLIHFVEAHFVSSSIISWWCVCVFDTRVWVSFLFLAFELISIVPVVFSPSFFLLFWSYFCLFVCHLLLSSSSLLLMFFFFLFIPLIVLMAPCVFLHINWLQPEV